MGFENSSRGGLGLPGKSGSRRKKLGAILTYEEMESDEDLLSNRHYPRRRSDAAISRGSPLMDGGITPCSNPETAVSSPLTASPWNQSSPYTKSPWIYQTGGEAEEVKNGLIGSLIREEGHVYSLATAGDLLYTGSESKNIRIWKNFQEFQGFKSRSGLVKAIGVFQNKIFTGHQDGKIRVWRFPGGGKRHNTHKRVGSLRATRDLLKTAINPTNYTVIGRKRMVPWIKHYDAVSCLSIDSDLGLLYSGSWDKTWKVWRISNSECLESVHGHDDAVNSIAIAFGLVFTGSADGTVKAWRRELVGRATQHLLVETMLRQDHAVTSLVTNLKGNSVYVGSSDGLVKFWERRKHFMAFGGVLRGHKQAVLCLASAGSLVMSGSADKNICIWRRDLAGEHTCVSVLSGHSGPVKCLAVEKDGGATDQDERWILYSGSLDRSVKVWMVPEFGPMGT